MWRPGVIAAMVGDSACLLYLAWLSAMDIRYKEISGRAILCGAFPAVIFWILQGKEAMLPGIAGMAVGICFLGIGRATREALGYADGWVIGILGIYLGIWRLTEVLALAWGTLAAASFLGLATGKWSRKTTLPVLPFLLAGYLMLLVKEGV